MAKKSKKRTHGGSRPGSGRKPKYDEALLRKTVTVPESLVQWAESNYDSFSAAVVAALEAAHKKAK